MVDALDEACHQSADPLEEPLLVVTERVRTGQRGRPKVHIDPAFLAQALELRGTTHLGNVFQCSARTVRRRAVDLGILPPGEPVYSTRPQEDGTVQRTYTSSSRAVSTLTNDELDASIASILAIFPSFGRRMISGRLEAAGHHVQRDRITASYLRVHGSPGVFGDRTIHRKRYHVAGANSLWHHDGQHGEYCLLLVTFVVLG